MTKVMLTGWLAGLLLTLAAGLPGRAAEEATQPDQPYVVLVGISQYTDPQILPKPHAEDDAKALYDLFTNKEYMGVDSNHIKLLVGSADSKRDSAPATHDNIIKALTWAATKAGRDQLVIFGFFGQGATLADRTCYFASDSTFKDRAKNSVAAGDIEHALEKLKSQRFCVFLDVNFKGFNAGKEAVPDPNIQNFYQEFLGRDEEKNPPPGRIVFLANRGLTPSLEQDNHSLFAKILLDGLKGDADKEGYEPDGLVTVDELIEYLDKKIPPLTDKLGKTKEEKLEIHHILNSRSSHFAITKNPAVTAKVRERLNKFAELVKEGKLSKELADEGQRLLSQMPKLEAQRSIRKDYQKLVDGGMTMEEFEKDRAKILDSMKLKRTVALSFAAKVIQATQTILKDYVKEENQGEMVGWAIKGLYQRLDEKIPKDIKDRLDKVKDMKEADLTILLADVRERLGAREDLANHKDLDFALIRMLHHLDPYTTYIDPETLAQFKIDTSGNFPGIGIQIRKDTGRDMLIVVTPILNSPAYRAKPLNADVKKVGTGLKAGDVITTVVREVDSEGKPLNPPEVLSTKGMPLPEAVKKIKGKPRTKVKITVEREGVDKPLEFEIPRGIVEMESVLGIHRHKDDSWEYMVDPENQIAYVRLTSFARNTYNDLERVIGQLEKKGVKGFILDLRFNPGGLLTSARDISDLFIDDGLIVTIRPRVGKEKSFYGEHDGSRLDFPMVCLVNGGSASGSEIVSACLQDHHRAIIMGERSYGKGSVQNIQDFEDGQLKLTVASFWRPNGKNLNKSSTSGKDDEDWGVTPDKGYLLKLPLKERDELFEHQRNQEIIARHDLPKKEEKPEFKDRQLEMALEYLRGQIKLAAKVPTKKAG